MDRNLAEAINKVFVEITEDADYLAEVESKGGIMDGDYDFDQVWEEAAKADQAIKAVFE